MYCQYCRALRAVDLSGYDCMRMFVLAMALIPIACSVCRADDADWRYCVGSAPDQQTFFISDPFRTQDSFRQSAVQFAGMIRAQGYSTSDVHCRPNRSREDAEQTVQDVIKYQQKNMKTQRLPWPSRPGDRTEREQAPHQRQARDGALS